MQKTNPFICALLVFSSILFSNSASALDNGELYPTPIDRESLGSWSAAFSRIGANAALNAILAGKTSRACLRTGYNPANNELLGVTSLVQKLVSLKKIPAGIALTDVLLLSRQGPVLIMDEPENLAKQPSVFMINEKHGRSRNQKLKKAGHTGHFYKPFLERPEMFY